MTFWHTERLTKKHRSSGKITRASNRAIIDDLTVRDLEPYFGHTTSGEDTRPKGEPITYPWKIWKPRSERTPEVEGSGGKNRLPKTKGATSSTAGRRSKIFKKSRRVVPKEKPRGGESRIEKKAILLPSPAQQQQQQPQRRKIRSRRSAAAESRNRRKIQTWRRDPEERRQMPARCNATARDTVREICKMEPARHGPADRASPLLRKLWTRKQD